MLKSVLSTSSESVSAGQRLGEVLGGRPQRLDRRLGDRHERAQLVLEDRRRLRRELLEALSAGARPSAAGSSSPSVGPSTSESVVGLLERGVGLAQRRRQQGAASPSGSPARWRTSGRRGWTRRRTGPAGCRCRRSPRRAGGSCGSSGGCVVALLELAVDALEVARERVEALERRRELLGVAVETLARAADQQLEVVARVGVETGEELVGVDGRLLWDSGSAPPSGSSPADGLPGSSAIVMSLSAVFGPQQRGRVAIDRRVLLLDLHLHDGLAVDAASRCRSRRSTRRRPGSSGPGPA